MFQPLLCAYTRGSSPGLRTALVVQYCDYYGYHGYYDYYDYLCRDCHYLSVARPKYD